MTCLIVRAIKFARRAVLDPFPKIKLKCGVTVVASRFDERWTSVISRAFHELEVEQFLVDFLNPGDVVIDAGANIGVLTTVAAKLVSDRGRVFAFEVHPKTFRSLIHTLSRNNIENVVTENIALSRPGCKCVNIVVPKGAWGAFVVPENSSMELNAVRAYFGASAIEKESVDAITLDEYVRNAKISKVDLIKIDVDGPELDILHGASEVLSKCRPFVIVEASMFNLDHGCDVHTLVDYLHSQKYELCYVERKKDMLSH